MPTASPFVYVASCAVQEFGIHHQSLFADVVSNDSALPLTFRSSVFEFFSPQSFRNDNGTPEVAFLGRSNVGKSSLVNALMRNNLARCSKSPGRTQQANYFGLLDPKNVGSEDVHYRPSDATGFFVDMPGYGYAKAPEANVDDWQKRTQEFFMDRRDAHTMRTVYCLVDARRGTTQTDRNVMGWFDDADISYTLVLTKADKVSRPQLVRMVNDVCMRYHSQLYGEDGGSQSPIVHITSSTKGEGIRELLSSIETEFLSAPESRSSDCGFIPLRTLS